MGVVYITLIGAHPHLAMNNQWGYPGSSQPSQQGGGWGSPSMNAARWQQQQQQMNFQQRGMPQQGFYQPTGPGLPGNWAGMNPNQGFSQFQSAPERHSPLVQHAGFMGAGSQQQFSQNQYSQHGGSQQGGPAITQQQQQHLLYQQQQQQQLMLQQQQQAIQDQMIKSQQEEMRKIEYERKQLKLKSINVSRVGSSAGPSLESLIGFSVPPPSSSSPSLTKHAVKSTPPLQPKPVPPQESSVVTTAIVTNVSDPVVTQQQMPSLAKQQPSVSLEGLMANSMNLLDERTTRPISKTDFPSSKTNHPPSTSSPRHPAITQQAPAWSVDTDKLSGLFAQHAQPNQEDDSFGDFQSVPSTQPQPGGVASSAGQSTSTQANTAASSHDAAGSSKQAFRQDELPLWMNYPAAIPNVYHTVYQKSWSGEGELTSTELLYPLLVSSGLERDTLRGLWTQVNRSVAGRLNKQELFLLLGLIGIVQSGKSTPSLADLKESFHPPSVTLSALQQHSDELIITTSSSHVPDKPTQSTPPLLSSSTASTDVFGTAQSAAVPIQTNQEEKYAVFHQLQETTASSTMQQDTGDIYSAFSALEPATSNTTKPVESEPTMGDTTRAPMSDFATFPGPAFNSGTSTSPLSSRHLPTASDNDSKSQTSAVPVTSDSTVNKVFGSAFIADFSSQPAVTGSQQTFSQPADNWGDFTSFSGSEWSQPLTSSTTLPSSTSTSFSVDSTPVWPQPTTTASSSATTMLFPPSVTTSSTVTPFSTTSDTTKEPSPAGFMDDFSEFSGYSSPQDTANGIERDSSVLSQVSSMSSSSQILEPQIKKLSQFEVWQKCLEKAAELLKTTSTVLSGSDKNTLEEIATAEESKKKLSGIGELYRFAKRVHVASHGPGKKSMTPSKNEQLVGLMVEVRKQWTAINSTLPNNTMSKLLGAMSSGVLPPDDRDSALCCLCLFPEHIFISPLVTMDSYSEQYSLAMTEHDGKKFHTQCANFWQFAISEKLNMIP